MRACQAASRDFFGLQVTCLRTSCLRVSITPPSSCLGGPALPGAGEHRARQQEAKQKDVERHECPSPLEVVIFLCTGRAKSEPANTLTQDDRDTVIFEHGDVEQVVPACRIIAVPACAVLHQQGVAVT